MTLGQDELLREFQDFAKTASAAVAVMEHIAQGLHEKMTRYNWGAFISLTRRPQHSPGRTLRRLLYTARSHSIELRTVRRCC